MKSWAGKKLKNNNQQCLKCWHNTAIGQRDKQPGLSRNLNKANFGTSPSLRRYKDNTLPVRQSRSRPKDRAASGTNHCRRQKDNKSLGQPGNWWAFP